MPCPLASWTDSICCGGAAASPAPCVRMPRSRSQRMPLGGVLDTDRTDRAGSNSCRSGGLSDSPTREREQAVRCCRSIGALYRFAYSTDGGETWSEPPSPRTALPRTSSTWDSQPFHLTTADHAPSRGYSSKAPSVRTARRKDGARPSAGRPGMLGGRRKVGSCATSSSGTTSMPSPPETTGLACGRTCRTRPTAPPWTPGARPPSMPDTGSSRLHGRPETAP
jgi:hypothetical protein